MYTICWTLTLHGLVIGNENTNGTEKSNRTSSAGGGGEYKETKRFRQHRLLTEDTISSSPAAKASDGIDDASKTTDTIRSRHSIKTKHKHKRMWHELSPSSSPNEQKNNTIASSDNIDPPADTKELIKSNVNDTANLLITIGDDGVSIDDDRVRVKPTSNNDNKASAANNAKTNDTSDNDDNVKQINTAVINDKAKNVAGNEDMGNNGAGSSRVKIQRITSARVVSADNGNSTSGSNFNTPSHRKKRRRILFSSTQPVPTDTSQNQPSNFQPLEQSFGQDHVPYVDFGRKIAAGGVAPRGHVNFYDSLLTEIRSRPVDPPKPLAVSEEEPIHEDMDVTMDRKTIEKNHVPNDRLHVASTNLANYYRRSTAKPSTTNATLANSTVCIPPYRIRRPYSGSSANKTLKREINQNIPLCQYNFTTTSKAEEVKPTEKPEPKKMPKNRIDSSTTFKTIGTSQVTESPAVASVDVTTPISNQFTTKILSTAVITSVSVKSNNDELTVPSEPYVSSADTPKPVEHDETRKKSKSEKSFDATYNSSGVSFSALNKNKPIQSTNRPSLTFYQRNTPKIARTSTRNLQFSKPILMSQLQSQSIRPVFNSTTSSDRPETNTKQYQVQPSIVSVLNLSDANVEYLLGAGNPTTESEPESSDLVDAEITTNELFNPKPTVVIVTVNERENLPVSGEYDQYNSSTPSIIAYNKNTEKNTENWRYRTSVETDESLLENSTSGGSQIYAIFSKSSLLNFTRVEVPVSSTTPKLAAKATSKPSTEEYAVGYQVGFHIITYVLAGLGVIPLVIGIFLITKMILSQNKKQIFEGSEYSSEYNRNPLEFNGGVTSSPIATKLPRVPHHMAHWEIEKKTFSSISLPNNSKWEFPRDKLRLQTILGQGNFGQVWKAEADDISGHEGLTRLVAVKMVKEISSTREKEDLIKELVIMQHLGSHPNVVTLLGCCTEKEPYMLIMEYVMYGKLLSFLRDHRTRSHYFNFSDNGDTLTSRDLTVFAYCVARGMEYLQNKQIIHRDLAARNILVDHNKLCKIADFGMSRQVGESGQVLEHRQSKGALPIRWMAPESLHYSCYTHKTDVWSFGILMWEIVTLGSMPYASMGARVVMRKVKEGYRLEKPKHCKSQLFNVINKCWYSDPNKRPTFTELKQDLGNLLEDPEHDGNYVDLDSLVEEMNKVVHGSHNEKIVI